MRKHVLIVEDDPDITEYIIFALELQGCSVIAFGTRDDALAYIKKQGLPDVILLDFMMPGMTASAFIDELTKISAELPRIVIMTAANEAFERARKVGVGEVLKKPFDASRIFELIEPCVA